MTSSSATSPFHTLAQSFFSIDNLAPQIPNEPTMTVHPENKIMARKECELLRVSSAPAAGFPISDLWRNF